MLIVLPYATDAPLRQRPVETMEIEWNGRRIPTKVRIAGSGWRFGSVSAVPYRFDPEKLGRGFRGIYELGGGVKVMSDTDYDIGEVTFEEARALADSFRKEQGLPEDMKPLYVSEYRRQVSGDEPVTIGHVLRYGHESGKTLIAGDSITLFVQKNGVKSMSGVWHTVRPVKQTGKGMKAFTSAALQACVNRFRMRYPMPEEAPKIEGVVPVYYVGHIREPVSHSARLVWQVCFEGGVTELWDPESAKTIERPRRELRPVRKHKPGTRGARSKP